jgi:hypothetical protein
MVKNWSSTLSTMGEYEREEKEREVGGTFIC